jgi:hypothetical protein
VDTFQGEEAKIVIVSLVRNSGSFEEAASIGFLKVAMLVIVHQLEADMGMFRVPTVSMSHFLEPSTDSSFSAMRQTCGRIQHGQKYLRKWRPMIKLAPGFL